MGTVRAGIWGESQREIRFVEGQVICQIASPPGVPIETAPLRELDEWLRAGFNLERSHLPLPPEWVLYEHPHPDSDTEWLEVVNEINASDFTIPGLTYAAYPDGLMAYHRVSAPPADALFSRQWALKSVGVDKAWKCTTGSPDVWLAIVDSGMPVKPATSTPPWSLVHPDLHLASRFKFGLAHDAGQTKFEEFSHYGATQGQLPTDNANHGTHVLGIMAAQAGNISDPQGGGTVGVNWTSPVYVTAMEPMIGFGGMPQGSGASQMAAAITEVARWMEVTGTGNVVINISLGGEDFTEQMVRKAVQFAISQGAIVVASTGNSFGDGEPDNCAGNVCAPATFASDFPHGVISVGAYAKPAPGSAPVVADWSNPKVGVADPGPVTVIAPGSGIHSTTFQGLAVNWGDMEGTSQAAPLVAGIVSLYWSLNQGLTNTQVIQAVMDSAIPLDPAATLPHPRWGFGRIDAEALICPDTSTDKRPPPSHPQQPATDELSDSADDPPVSSLDAIWRQKIEACAVTLSDAVLREILEGQDCGNTTSDQLAAALWLKEWLGESDWDGTGRVSGG